MKLKLISFKPHAKNFTPRTKLTFFLFPIFNFLKKLPSTYLRRNMHSVILLRLYTRRWHAMSKVICNDKGRSKCWPRVQKGGTSFRIIAISGKCCQTHNESDFTSSALVQLIEYEAPTFPMGEKLVYTWIS